MNIHTINPNVNTLFKEREYGSLSEHARISSGERYRRLVSSNWFQKKFKFSKKEETF